MTEEVPEKQKKKQRGNPENLKPYQFKPGQSGNPKGRPPGNVSITALIKQRLAAHDFAKARELADELIGKATSGDVDSLRALIHIIDRVEGSVAKRQEISVEGAITKIVQLEEDADAEGEGDAS